MITTQKIKYGDSQFLMIFYNGQWWYIAKEMTDYLGYSESSKAVKLIANDENKLMLKKKGNEDLFKTIFEVSAWEGDTSKIANITVINEDGLITLALNSTKSNAKLLVQDMIKVFKVELDKAGISALEYLLRIEKDKNILINARTTKYYNKGVIKYSPMVINMAINELVYYKYFADTKYSSTIKTDQLREIYENESGLKDRDVSQDRYDVGNSILEMLYNYYLFNNVHMSLKQAKYLYVKNNGYEESIVNMFKERLVG